MSDLQQLRNSFDLGDQVLMQKRQYGETPALVMTGTIVRKDSSTAAVRFVRGTSVQLRVVPYSRLKKASEVRPRTRQPDPVVEVKRGPKPRTPHFKPDAEIHVAEIIHRSPKGYRSSEPDEPLRTVPPAFQNLGTSLEKSDASSYAPKPATSSSSTDDLTAWLDMGNVLVEQIERRAKALDEEAETMRVQARALLAQADTRAREAEELRHQLVGIEKLRRAAEIAAKQLLGPST